MRRGKTHHNPQQTPLFMPETDWVIPEEFPDLSYEDVIYVDTETRDPNLSEKGPGFLRNDAEIVGCSLSTVSGDAWYFPVAHAQGENCDKGAVVSYLTDVMSYDNTKVMHNAMYDVEALDSEGIEVSGDWMCTMVTDAIIHELSTRYNLNAVADRRAYGQQKDQTLLEEAAQAYGVDPKSGLWQLPPEYVGAYAEQDAALLHPIASKQLQLIKEMNLDDVFNMECDLLKVVWAMRKKGVRIDVGETERLKEEWDAHRNYLFDSLGNVDPWSPDSLADFCTTHNIAYELTGKGNPSFESAWLSGHTNETLQRVAEARKYDKVIRDCLDGMLLSNLVGDRVHAQFHTTRRDDYGTRSGRFSSSNPNLQQVPGRDPVLGPAIRKLFIPDEDGAWGKFDYSSQEPRVTVHLAALSQCRGVQDVLQRYQRDKHFDMHEYASNLVRTSRRDAKGIGLGITYGMGAEKLAAELGCSLDEARGRKKAYSQAMPFVQEIADLYSELMRTQGYVTTPFGRRANSEGSQWTYKALNRAVQGAGADMIKLSMVAVHKELDMIPMLTVHDELNYTLYEEGVEHKVVEIMENVLPLKVPALVEPEVGPSWGEVK